MLVIKFMMGGTRKKASKFVIVNRETNVVFKRIFSEGESFPKSFHFFLFSYKTCTQQTHAKVLFFHMLNLTYVLV